MQNDPDALPSNPSCRLSFTPTNLKAFHCLVWSCATCKDERMHACFILMPPVLCRGTSDGLRFIRKVQHVPLKSTLTDFQEMSLRRHIRNDTGENVKHTRASLAVWTKMMESETVVVHALRSIQQNQVGPEIFSTLSFNVAEADLPKRLRWNNQLATISKHSLPWRRA